MNNEYVCDQVIELKQKIEHKKFKLKILPEIKDRLHLKNNGFSGDDLLLMEELLREQFTNLLKDPRPLLRQNKILLHLNYKNQNYSFQLLELNLQMEPKDILVVIIKVSKII